MAYNKQRKCVGSEYDVFVQFQTQTDKELEKQRANK